MENKISILIKEDPTNIIKSTLQKCNSFLFNIDTTVYIFPCDFKSDFTKYKMGGIIGVTLGSGRILLLINPMPENWETFLPYVVAHEYHHSVWTYRKYKTTWMTLLQNLIFEGRADLFADIVYPNVEVPWTSSLSIIREKEMWDEIKENLNSVDNKYQRKIMFGGYKGIPEWCGYRIGYDIMQEFIKNNPDVSIEEWTDMKAKDILKKSGYEKSLEKRLEEYSN